MDEQLPNFEDYLAILKRRKWQLIVPILLLAPVAIFVAMTLPEVYRSTATIMIEQQEIPTDLIRTTITSFADQRVQVISQRVLTTKNLSDIIEKYDLYPALRAKASMNTAVSEMRKGIALEMINADVVDPRSGSAKKATIAFTLAFDYGSAVIAQKVTNELVSLFLNENLRQREASVEEATDFLRGEADRLGDQIARLEAAMAKFKEEHSDNLPEHQSLNRELMARTEDQLRDNALALRALEEQELYLETELGQMTPQISLGSAAGGMLSGPETRLRELEARYAGIAARYSATHPDRLQMERELTVLRKQVSQLDTNQLDQRLAELKSDLAAARERYSPKHPDVMGIERNIALVEKQIREAKQRSGVAAERVEKNPAYIELHTRLEETKLETNSLREAQEQLKAQLAQYEQRLIKAPDIEREYRNLTRDYDNALSKYREIKDKQMEAELAKALESERKAERFTLIEPPIVPEKPLKPNRPAILMLGIALSFGGGFGNLAIRELMDKGLRGASALQRITHAPPLAVIPYIQTRADRHRLFRRRAILVGSAVIFVVVGLVAVHMLIMPLDVLWFSLPRRLEAFMPVVGYTFLTPVPTWNG